MTAIPRALAAGLLAIAVTDVARAHSLTLGTTPPTGIVAPGDTLEVTLDTGADFAGATGVNIDLTYDADLLSYQTTDFDPAFGFAQDPQREPADATGPTTIRNITATGLPSGVGSGEATLATLSFLAVAPGSGAISLSGTSGELIVGPGDPVDATLTAAVRVIPLPAPLLLLGSALVGLGVLARRRAASAG